MDDEQFYLFDSMGLLVLRNQLSSTELCCLNQKIDERLGSSRVSKFPIIELGQEFMDLLSSPPIVAACRRVLGDAFRFDHAFGLQQPTANPNLHGGPYACQSSCFYHVGQSTTGVAHMGRISVGFALTPQSKETGGFAYIPGSHKSGSLMHGSQVLSSLLGGNFDHECIFVPTLRPGDACIFPDCLVHGTAPWKANYTRRALYYMYSPGFMAWRPYSEIEKYLPLARTPLQKQLLRPPYVAGFTETATSLGDNRWRDPNP